MKKFLEVTRLQARMDAESSFALTMAGLRAARIRVNDPLAIGIEEFLCPIPFVPFRLPISQNPIEKRNRRRSPR